jgi:alkylation response protein AidB-like acyl-CoA dehydrogenase
LLGHERSGIARIGASKAQLSKLLEIAAQERCGDGLLIDDEDFKRDVAQVEIDLHTLEYTELRALMSAAKGESPGPEANVLKIRGTELQQRIAHLLMQTLGYYAMPFVPEAKEYGYNEEPAGPGYAAPLASHYFNIRKASIYGGSNEIQRNIIAKMVLGL